MVGCHLVGENQLVYSGSQGLPVLVCVLVDAVAEEVRHASQTTQQVVRATAQAEICGSLSGEQGQNSADKNPAGATVRH